MRPRNRPSRRAARARSRPVRSHVAFRATARAVALLGVGLALAACGPRGDERVGWSFERMIRQPSYRAFEGAAFFPDSLAMRPPPEGTVPRTAPVGDAAVLTGRTGPDSLALRGPGTAGPAGPRRERAPYVARIPVRLDRNALRRGRDRFRIFCAVCHGIDGQGDSPVADNMALRKPPSLLEPRLRDAPDGRIFSVITEGYGLMPSYAAELGVRDRWAVVAYVRALQLAQRTSLAELPDTIRAAFERAVPARVP